MSDVCLVFLLHHAERLRHIRAADSPFDGGVIDDVQTTESLRQAASRSFLPALKLLREAVERSDGAVRFGLCPTGPLLRSAELHHSALMRSLHRLNATGAVEWICSPADASILGLFPGDHLQRQLDRQAQTIERLFGARPTCAANTELIYDNAVARQARATGLQLVLCGHADRQLGGRTANRVYRASGDAGVRVMARHVGLSDDWGVRFSDPTWACHPLKAETYVDWLAGGLAESGGGICPIILHLGDLGLTHGKESGIFSFSRRVLSLLLRRGLSMLTPSQAAGRAGALAGLDVLDVPQSTSGWGPSFDLSPWLGNAMQSNALHLLRRLLQGARAAGDERVEEALHRLCAADHLGAMRHAHRDGGTAGGAGLEVPPELRRRPSPFESPYEAYLTFTGLLRCLADAQSGSRSRSAAF
jgi:alpha-amylase